LRVFHWLESLHDGGLGGHGHPSQRIFTTEPVEYPSWVECPSGSPSRSTSARRCTLRAPSAPTSSVPRSRPSPTPSVTRPGGRSTSTCGKGPLATPVPKSPSTSPSTPTSP